MRVLICGGRGLVGSSLRRELYSRSIDFVAPSSIVYDLRDEIRVIDLFKRVQPTHVIVAAGRVGGIMANSRDPDKFLVDNMRIGMNVIHEANRVGVEQLVYLGSSCIYPKHAPNPIKEESLLDGRLEPTNEGYALAKIACTRLCQYYREKHGVNFHTLMPCNLYGPGDRYHDQDSHVIPALIQRFHHAKLNGDSEVAVWGSGRVIREFMYVDDLARAISLTLGMSQLPVIMNVGTSEGCTIRQLATTIAKVVGFEGKVVQDTFKPDGTPKKVTCSQRIRELGWEPQVKLEDGLRVTYDDFIRRAC